MRDITEEWYNNRLYVILLLIVVFPVGIYALWKSNKFSVLSKIILTGIIIFAGFRTYENKKERKTDTEIKNSDLEKDSITTPK